MEELNKTQLILLTLLVSFVTSIGTGIITVSLLQEAPPGVTQTINRVVEKTIERVVPADGGGTQTVKETTVVVKEEDLVIDAINKNAKAIVRIRDNALVDGVAPFYGIGFLVSANGFVIADFSQNLNNSSTYTATLSDGSTFQMKPANVDQSHGIVFFQVIKDPSKPFSVSPVNLATKDVQLGQTVIGIEGEKDNLVSIGRVASFEYAGEGSKKTVSAIDTDIKSKTKVYGGPLVNLNGEVIGMRVSGLSPSVSGETYISLAVLKDEIAQFAK